MEEPVEDRIGTMEAPVADDALLGRLAVSLAHHLRNPLASIGANTELILDCLEPEDPRREPALRILTDADRMSRLVAEVLRFASLRAGPARPVGIVDLVNSRIEGLGEAQSGATLRFEATDDARGLSVPADPELAGEALIRVLKNATEAVGTGGEVRVTVMATPSGGAEILVEDSGAGIGEFDRERIFEPFYSTKNQGLGLGLAFARRAIECLGGSLELVHTGREGSCFRFGLPGGTTH